VRLVLVDCRVHNQSTGPIRFRIGFREYLVGYLVYHSVDTRRHSPTTTNVVLSLASCLFTVSFLVFLFYLCVQWRQSTSATRSTSTRATDLDSSGKSLWSTATSATAVTSPYYQVYEQICSSVSSHDDNTLRRSSLAVCPYHCRVQTQQHNATLTLRRLPSSSSEPSLKTISIDHQHLKRFFLPTSCP
jgi:heme/copper-type cytochrome/quinol oxidase subunit 1